MLDMFDDWQAAGVTAILHEKKGGYANNVRSLRGLAAKAESEGVRIVPGVRVTGLRTGGGAVTAVETGQGGVRRGQLIIPAGPRGPEPSAERWPSHPPPAPRPAPAPPPPPA